MLLFVDNQHSCLKAYAVTLLDGCFSEARSAVIRINVDPRGGKKKKRKKRWLFRVSNESMLDQTSNATNASALDKENYARAYLVLYRLSIVQFFFGGRELKTPLLRRSMRLLQYFYAISFIWSKRTKFRRLLVDNKRSKISDKIYINIASIIFQSWIIFFTIDIHFRYL